MPKDVEELSAASVGSQGTHIERLNAANTWLQEEIKRLRLTDEEREAVAVAIAECESMPVTRSRVAADTLRSVLERLK